VKFPEGMVVKGGDFLDVVVETARETTELRLCFDREIAPGKKCFFLLLKNKGYGELRRIPMTLPSVDYRRD